MHEVSLAPEILPFFVSPAVDEDANQSSASGGQLQPLFWKKQHYGMTSGVPLLPVQEINELTFPHNPAQHVELLDHIDQEQFCVFMEAFMDVFFMVSWIPQSFSFP